MSLSLPEFAVRDTIAGAIAIMWDDERVVADMLGSRPVEEQDSFRTALERREGKVRLGWAMEPVEDWLVTVLMASDMPHETIGMMASRPSEDELAQRQLAAAIGKTEDLVVTFSTGVPDIGTDEGEVPATGLLRIGDEIATYAIVSGVCRLKKRGGIRSTPVAAHAVGATVTFFETSQRSGYPEMVIVRADVMGSNPDFIMKLARMLQAFLVRAAADFDAQGYTLQEITLSDLATRPAFYPAHLFLRSLTIKVETTLSLPEAYPVLTDTVVHVTAEGDTQQPMAGVMP